MASLMKLHKVSKMAFRCFGLPLGCVQAPRVLGPLHRRRTASCWCGWDAWWGIAQERAGCLLSDGNKDCSSRNTMRIWRRAPCLVVWWLLVVWFVEEQPRLRARIRSAGGRRPLECVTVALPCVTSFEEWFLLRDRNDGMRNQGYLRGQNLDRWNN